MFIFCVNIWSLLLDFLFPVETGLVFCQIQFLTILLLKIQVLWDVTLHCWVSGSHCVEMFRCFIFKGNQPMMMSDSLWADDYSWRGRLCFDWVVLSQNFEWLCDFIFLSPRRVIFMEWLPLKLRVAWSFEMLGTSDPKTQHLFPEDMNLQHWYLSWHVWRSMLNNSSCCSFFGRLPDFIMSYYS